MLEVMRIPSPRAPVVIMLFLNTSRRVVGQPEAVSAGEDIV